METVLGILLGIGLAAAVLLALGSAAGLEGDLRGRRMEGQRLESGGRDLGDLAPGSSVPGSHASPVAQPSERLDALVLERERLQGEGLEVALAGGDETLDAGYEVGAGGRGALRHGGDCAMSGGSESAQ